MRERWERLWVSWLNSSYWRGLTAKGPAYRFFRSEPFQRFDRARRYLLTSYRSRRHPALFDDVQTFCTFVGHVKSGSTLLGSLLDAHPDAIIADEVDVPAYVAGGFRKEQIFHILLKGSRRDQMKGRVTARRLTPYAVSVPGQWQGRYRRLRVIGHSQAGPVTRQLRQNPQLLEQMAAAMPGVDLKVIHVIRNPFDPISLMIVRGNRSFANAIDHYFSYCEALDALSRQRDEDSLLPVRYEAFVDDPQAHLQKICRFLGLEATDDYLHDCAQILYDAPEQSRSAVNWTQPWIDIVEQRIEAFPFLQGYSYDAAHAEDGARAHSLEGTRP